MPDRYWVGGSASWDATAGTKWALTSGGPGGEAVPTAADDVYFDGASGAVTITLSGARTCLSFNSTGFTGTVAGTGTLTVSGNATYGSGTTFTNTGTWTFNATSGTQQITTNGKTLDFPITQNSPGATLQLQDNLTMGSTRTFTLTAGTLDLSSGNRTLSAGLFSSSNSNTRSIAFGTGNITVTGNNATVWTVLTATNLTYTGTPTVNFTYSGSTGTRTINGGTTGTVESNALNYNINNGADGLTFVGSAKNLNFTGFAGTLGNSARTVFGNLTFSSGMTGTGGTNATTLAATTGTQQITTNGITLDFPLIKDSAGSLQLQDNLTIGSTRTFTLTAGTLDLSSGNRTLSTGLFSSSNSNTRSIVFGTGKIVLTAGNTGVAIWNMATATGFTYTGTPRVEAAYTATSLGTRTISHGGSGGGVESNAIDVYITSGTDTVAVITHIGNLDFTGFTGTFNNGTSSRRIYKDIKFVSGMTFSGGTAAISMFSASNTQNFTSAGLTIDAPVRFEGAANTTVFQDSLTMGATREMRVTSGTAKLKSGATTTVGTFATTGTAQKFLESTTPGVQATISQASGNVSASYLSIKDINATGGANWVARTDLGSKDLGNNTGWNFIYIAIQQILKPIMDKILKPIILN